MKKAVMKYKKASRALRTFNSAIRQANISQRVDLTDDQRREYYTAQSRLRSMLDKTLGQDALAALYWEGKEF